MKPKPLLLILAGGLLLGGSEDGSESATTNTEAAETSTTTSTTQEPQSDEVEIRQVAEEWAALFATADEGSCELSNGHLAATCDIYTRDEPSLFQESFEDAPIVSIDVMGNEALVTFGEIGQRVVFSDEGGWGPSDIGRKLDIGDDPEPAESPKKKSKSTPKPDESGGSAAGGETGGWKGLLANTYKVARDVCGAFSLSKVAKDLGLPPSSDAFTVAEEYAKGSTAEHQQPAFEGCLEGLTK